MRFLMSLLIVLCASVQVSAAELTAKTDPQALDDLRVATGAQDIAAAWLINPTTRYQHYVLGSNYEAGGLRVKLRDGRTLDRTLDGNHVFEDRQPRLADLDGDGRDEIILVLTSRTRGASLAVYDVADNAINLKAKTPFIGRAYRWLNPAGIADFTGDGVLDVAFVAMPHLVKELQIWSLVGGRLEKQVEFDGFSNHRNGSPHTAMSATADFDGDGIADLALPGADRRSIRVVSMAGGKLEEINSVALPFAADGAFELIKLPDTFKLHVPMANGETAEITL